MVKAQKLQPISKELKEKKGFMSLRNNVYDSKLELWHVLKPLEMHVVDILIRKTIGWRKNEAKITIKYLMEQCRLDHTRIYRTLKSLEDKEVIIRKKKGNDLIIGLNNVFFGQLLTDKHQRALEKRKQINCVVDNSKTMCKSSTDAVQSLHVPCASSEHVLCQTSTQIAIQKYEIIKENVPLNTLLKDIPKNTSLKDSKIEGGNGESFSLLGIGNADKNRNPLQGKYNPEQLDDPQSEMNRQIQSHKRQMEMFELTELAKKA